MSILTRLEAYSHGDIPLATLAHDLPQIGDGSPELSAFTDALEAGIVPPEVYDAWSHGLAHASAPATPPEDPSEGSAEISNWPTPPTLEMDELPPTESGRRWTFRPKIFSGGGGGGS